MGMETECVDSCGFGKTYVCLYPGVLCVKHYSKMVAPGSKILQYKAKGEDNQPVIIFLTPENQYLVVAGNFNGKQQNLSVKLAGKYLEVTLQPHSLNTFYTK